VLHVIRPDGVQTNADGIVARGWAGESSVEGRHVARQPAVGAGPLSILFEWDQKHSPEAELTVCEWDLQDRILARWVFEGDDFQHAAAVLTVENQTDRVLRFARLGIMGSEVWLSCTQDGLNPSQESTFYPWKELFPGEDISRLPAPGSRAGRTSTGIFW
jgi:hypothetical protein